MHARSIIAVAGGALLSAVAALAGATVTAGPLVERLSNEAKEITAGTGVRPDFGTEAGWPTRHPLLTGGEKLPEARRDKLAKGIGAIAGVGGVRWADGSIRAQAAAASPLEPLHCQRDVEALLRARTIRFEESSAAIDPASHELIGEVARALRPCLGSIIAITGHTDKSGTEPGNLALSSERAEAVRAALVSRGIPADGLRTRGMGSALPVEGLDPADPANRRIEFSVIAIVPLRPTPVDTPGPR